MAGHLPRGVVAAVFARGVDARDAERLDLLGLGRLAVARDIEEFPVEIARDAARELQAIELQRGGETRNLIGRERELRRVHPYGIDRCAHGERLAVAVSDGAAMGGDLEHPREPGITLAGKEAVIDQLQVDRAPNETERRERQQCPQESCTPAKGHRRAIAYAARLHGEMISISFGGGVAM